MTSGTKRGKVSQYESDYIESLDPWSYDDTSECSATNDARIHKSSGKFITHLDDFLPES